MAKAKRNAADENNSGERTAADKIASLLALIVTKDMEPDAAALKLDAIGFTSREISDLLEVGPNYVNVARHRRKSGRTKARKKRN
jgi:hypothetical protein